MWGCCDELCHEEPLPAAFTDAIRAADEEQAYPMMYPMYTLRADVLLKLEKPKPHEELLLDGRLEIFEEHLGQAMFVSHEWCGVRHPDPEGEQVRVLQAALRHMLDHTEKIEQDIPSEIMFGVQPGMMTSELKAKTLYVWFDYFCCPQLVLSLEGSGNLNQQHAIRSIPAYVQKSRFFVVHSPFVHQDSSSTLLSKRTWSTRGWCRLERLASQFNEETAYLIEVRSAKHQSLMNPWEYLRDPVGEGEFTVDSDRGTAGQVVRSMFAKKLNFYLRTRDIHRYRVLLNLQYSQYRGLPVEPIDDLIKNFRSKDQALQPALSFLHQNGFKDAVARDAAGWTPMCYAAVRGDPEVMKGLLSLGAWVDDRLTQATPKLFMVKKTCLLVICIFFGHHEALRFLLSRGADVHATDEYGSTPMHYACANQNAQALEMLRQAGASAVMSNVLGHTPRVLAAGAGFRPASLEIIHQMLTKVTQEELSMALHLSILFGSASAATVSALIRRGADLNARLSFPIFSTMGLLFRFMSWRQQCNRSAAGYYAAQHADATPLMCCILCGAFEAAAVLLASGARLDLKNRHGLRAQDLVRELGAPDFVVSAMQGRAQEAAIMECLAAELIST